MRLLNKAELLLLGSWSAVVVGRILGRGGWVGGGVRLAWRRRRGGRRRREERLATNRARLLKRRRRSRSARQRDASPAVACRSRPHPPAWCPSLRCSATATTRGSEKFSDVDGPAVTGPGSSGAVSASSWLSEMKTDSSSSSFSCDRNLDVDLAFAASSLTSSAGLAIGGIGETGRRERALYRLQEGTEPCMMAAFRSSQLEPHCERKGCRESAPSPPLTRAHCAIGQCTHERRPRRVGFLAPRVPLASSLAGPTITRGPCGG